MAGYWWTASVAQPAVPKAGYSEPVSSEWKEPLLHLTDDKGYYTGTGAIPPEFNYCMECVSTPIKFIHFLGRAGPKGLAIKGRRVSELRTPTEFRSV